MPLAVWLGSTRRLNRIHIRFDDIATAVWNEGLPRASVPNASSDPRAGIALRAVEFLRDECSVPVSLDESTDEVVPRDDYVSV